MNKNILYLLVLLAVAVLAGCEETVKLESEQVEPKVVIEGLVTNENIQHYVKVSRSAEFYSSGDFTGVTDAVITVEDDQGNVYNYVHNPSSAENGEGYYLSEDAFAGQIGSTYTLTVTLGSEVYTATDIIKPVTAIDSLEVSLNEEEFDDPEDEGYFYEILFYAKEPQDTEDYYLFKFYRNDSLFLDTETDIYYANDDLLGESIDGIPTAGFYKLGDKARVEMYSISRQGYIYYNDLYTLLNSDGGMFSPPPANPRSNLSNNALGYFQASAVVSDSIVVE
ncbi:hypothetical protein GCM10009122_41630 [Fulvivirga kasyanovii]|uniref:DUF4249 domain-containing protein n=1 Tax=Fulvivirga kasyanovii TaxID=396812 RepID=A0ABW9RVS4_9BACT|nr:DUF4249 domain-containing protein [Fulvivirga kasyanovii]MTI27349.1 DUF4249 domain-containing protein [Fulvivirga kasyanovii]